MINNKISDIIENMLCTKYIICYDYRNNAK